MMNSRLSASALLQSDHSHQPPSSSTGVDKISLLFYGFVNSSPHHAKGWRGWHGKSMIWIKPAPAEKSCCGAQESPVKTESNGFCNLFRRIRISANRTAFLASATRPGCDSGVDLQSLIQEVVVMGVLG
jgi:hypothetical protein